MYRSREMTNDQISGADPETDPGRSDPPGFEGDGTLDGEAEAPVTAPETAARPTLRGRAQRYWTGLSPRRKAVVIAGGVGALALAGGLLARRRGHPMPGEDASASSSGVADLIQSGMDKLRSLQSAGEPFGDVPIPADPGSSVQYVAEEWDVADYMRDTCLDRALHPNGCRHEDRPVRGGIRRRNPDLLASDD
nr:hypothetical protein KPHV_87790 [Kitasatospora purpeofusca]